MLLDNDVVMMEEDDIIRYATELLDAVDNGWLNDDTKVDRFTYAHLVAMFLATSNMDNGAKLYSYCYDAAIRCGVLKIFQYIYFFVAKARQGSNVLAQPISKSPAMLKNI